MKKSPIIAGLIIVSLSLSTINIALAKPDKVPQGITSTSNINGIFADYFINLASSPCTGNIVTGFSNSEFDYLTPKCKSIKEILHAYFLDLGLLSSSPIVFTLAGEAENLLTSFSTSSQWGNVAKGIAYTGSTSNNNVAIGTEDPKDGKLYVAGKTIVGDENGNYTGTEWDHALQVNGGTTGIPSIGFNNNGTVGVLFYSSAIGFVIGRDIGWGVTNITMPGNVGIGTNAGLAALTVSGVVIADTPTAPNHLATKAYVDAMLGNNVGEAGCTIIGGRCGGGILAGVSDGYSIIVTPPGCTDSTTPTCDHYGTDIVKKTWNNGTAVSLSPGVAPGSSTSSRDGYTNTNNLIVIGDSGSPYLAAKYCANMIYNGQDDWYLPSIDELVVVMSNSTINKSFGSRYNFTGDFIRSPGYWTSTQSSLTSANILSLVKNNNGPDSVGVGSANKNDLVFVRCIRKM